MANNLPTLAELKSFIEATNDDVSKLTHDLNALYVQYDIPKIGDTLKRNCVTHHIAMLIQRCFPIDMRPYWSWVLKIRKAVIIESTMTDSPLEPYLSTVNAIHGSIRSPEHNKSDSDRIDWHLVCQLARDMTFLGSTPAYFVKPEQLSSNYPRAIAVAGASIRLRDQGFECNIVNGEPRFSDAERKRIVASIEDQICAIGARQVVERLFLALRPTWHDEMGRYLLGRHVDALGLLAKPQCPVAFLLNLAAKHLHAQPASQGNSEIRQQWRKLLQDSSDLASNYDVQPYLIYELWDNNCYSISSFVNELAVYDGFFDLKQFRPGDLPNTIRGLFDWVDDTLEEQLGWSIETMAILADIIFNQQPLPSGICTIFAADIVDALPPDRQKEAAVALQVLIHDQPPNQEFNLPEASKALNLTKRPLIRQNSRELLLLDSSLCASSCFEPILLKVLAIRRNTLTEVGFAAERFLRRRIMERGVEVLFGKYIHDDGECDLVVETKHHVILGELKIKSLTRAAQSGDDLEIMVDLAATLFDSAFQCNKHELQLRKRGYLDLLLDGGQERRLSLENRQIEKISITFDDFGGFQDRLVIDQVFRSLLGARIEAVDVSKQKKLENLNEKAKVMGEQYRELAALEPRYKKGPFFNYWFLSVPQMLVILDRVISNESFKDELWKARHLTASTLNFYAELAQARST